MLARVPAIIASSVLTRRTQFELRQAEARLHILDGLLIALKNLDAVIKLIRASKDAETARTRSDEPVLRSRSFRRRRSSISRCAG